MLLSCGGSFEGTYIEGKKQGQGKLTYADGRTLEGEWRNNKICNGKGTLVTGDRQALTGEWVNFRFFSTEHLNFLTKNAQQEEKPQAAVSTTVGKFETAESVASVEFVNKQAAVFKGALINANKKHGQGQITYPDGSVYEGEWLKEKRHGAGRLTSAAGEVFEGVFEKDVPVSGKGVLPFKDGGKYEGELVQGKRHGQGKITYPDGRTLEGEFQEGKLWTGKGVFTHQN
eukprot:gene39255-biopygen27035